MRLRPSLTSLPVRPLAHSSCRLYGRTVTVLCAPSLTFSECTAEGRRRFTVGQRRRGIPRSGPALRGIAKVRPFVRLCACTGFGCGALTRARRRWPRTCAKRRPISSCELEVESMLQHTHDSSQKVENHVVRPCDMPRGACIVASGRCATRQHATFIHPTCDVRQGVQAADNAHHVTRSMPLLVTKCHCSPQRATTTACHHSRYDCAAAVLCGGFV